MQKRAHTDQTSHGFTLIELLIVVVITSIMLGLIAVNLGQPQRVAGVSGGLDTLLADIKGQQILAMAGDTGSQTTAQTQGILFASKQYTLFTGAYSPADSYNFTVSLPANTTLTTTFPSNQLIFSKGDGSVAAGTNTITLTNGTITRIITVNRLGALVVN